MLSSLPLLEALKCHNNPVIQGCPSFYISPDLLINNLNKDTQLSVILKEFINQANARFVNEPYAQLLPLQGSLQELFSSLRNFHYSEFVRLSTERQQWGNLKTVDDPLEISEINYNDHNMSIALVGFY